MITDDIGIGYYTLLYNIELNLLSILKLITFPSHFFTIVANKIRVVCTTIFLKASNIFIHFFSKIQIQIPPRFEKWIFPSYPPWTLITFYLFFPKQVDNSFRLHPMTLCFRSYPLNSNCDHPPWTKTPMLLACLKNVCKRHVQQSFSNACLYRISPISPRIYLTALLRPIKTDLQSRNRDSTQKEKGGGGEGRKEGKEKKGTKEIRNGVTRWQAERKKIDGERLTEKRRKKKLVQRIR